MTETEGEQGKEMMNEYAACFRYRKKKSNEMQYVAAGVDSVVDRH